VSTSILDQVLSKGHPLVHALLAPVQIRARRTIKVLDLNSFGNYYKDFIANYSTIACPLHELTKKSRAWSWQDAEQNAFDTLKEKFTSYPVL